MTTIAPRCPFLPGLALYTVSYRLPGLDIATISPFRFGTFEQVEEYRRQLMAECGVESRTLPCYPAMEEEYRP
jgi:hypothetical protein